MKSQGQDVSVKSISSYLGYFKDAYLLSSVDRYDIHGKKLLESNEKLYFGDVGLRNLIAGGEREGDIEKIMENIVYQQSKYVISMTPLVKRSDRKGIIHIGLREFLKKASNALRQKKSLSPTGNRDFNMFGRINSIYLLRRYER